MSLGSPAVSVGVLPVAQPAGVAFVGRLDIKG